MATSSKISNQSNRASAILKVVGIYLLTFTVLTLIFNLTRTRETEIRTNGSENVSAKYKQAKKNEEGLSKMIGILDSITKLNKELQALDEKDVEKVDGTGEKTKINDINIILKNLQESLTNETGGVVLNDDRDKAKQINHHLSQSSDQIRSLREKLIAQVNKFEKDLEKVLETASDEKDQLSTQLENQGGKINESSDDLDDLQDEIDNLNAEKEAWALLKVELANDLQAMKMKIDEQLNERGLFKNNWKGFTNDLKGDVRDLSLKMR